MNALTLTLSRSHRALLSVAIAFAIGGPPAHAQEVDHSRMPMPTTSTDSPAAAKKKAADPHAGHDMQTSSPPTAPESTAADPAAMRPDKPTLEPDTQTEPMDHSAMGHEMPMPSDQPRQPVPPLTDADRVAAFPAVAGHAAHDNTIQTFVL